MSSKYVTLDNPPQGIDFKPQASLVKSDFDSFIWDKGYNVYHDKMILCPCKSINAPSKSTCKNCRGVGYVIIEREETKMVLQGMNLETKFKPWTEDKIGMAKITALNDAKLSHFDRIILIDAETTYNQIIYPTLYKNKLFGWLIYEAIRAERVFLFDTDNNPLLELFEGKDFIFEDNKFILDDKYKTNLPQKQYQISIRYVHRPQFHIIEILRDVINTWTLEDGMNREKNVTYPIHAIARRSHLTVDQQNFDKTNLNDNTQKNDN